MRRTVVSLKILAVGIAVILLCAVALVQGSARAEELDKPLQVVAVADGKVKGVASLFGNGENYITDIKVQVKFDSFAPYYIELEDGYSPAIYTFDFGGEDKLLFCSSQTGGSGGYGNYRVYRLNTDSYKLLYDDKIDSDGDAYCATFEQGGYMRIGNYLTQYTLDVSLGYMDRTYYDMIFTPDGEVREGQKPNINAVSFVAPTLNPASGIFRLMTYRSVVAVAEVNRLGYIVATLDFDGEKFTASFSEFSIGI